MKTLLLNSLMQIGPLKCCGCVCVGVWVCEGVGMLLKSTIVGRTLGDQHTHIRDIWMLTTWMSQLQ